MTSTLLVKFLPRRPSADKYRVVTAGRVACPRSQSGDVDVDRCTGCPFMIAAEVDWDSVDDLILCNGGARSNKRFDTLDTFG